MSSHLFSNPSCPLNLENLIYPKAFVNMSAGFSAPLTKYNLASLSSIHCQTKWYHMLMCLDLFPWTGLDPKKMDPWLFPLMGIGPTFIPSLDKRVLIHLALFPWIGSYLSLRNNQRSRNRGRFQGLASSQNPGILWNTADLGRFSTGCRMNKVAECHRGHWLNLSCTIRHCDNTVPIETGTIMSFSLMRRRSHLLCQCLWPRTTSSWGVMTWSDWPMSQTGCSRSSVTQTWRQRYTRGLGIAPGT